MRRAWDRINAVPAERLRTGFGTIEYTQKGQRVPSWSVMGCWGVMSTPWTADGRRCRGPVSGSSRRLGLGTFIRRCRQVPPLPTRRTPTLCCSTISASAARSWSGSPLAAARFWSSGCVTPHRVIGLILASCRLGGGVTVNTVFAPVLRLAFGADRLFAHPWGTVGDDRAGRPPSSSGTTLRCARKSTPSSRPPGRSLHEGQRCASRAGPVGRPRWPTVGAGWPGQHGTAGPDAFPACGRDWHHRPRREGMDGTSAGPLRESIAAAFHPVIG